MNKLIDSLLSVIDRATEKRARKTATSVGRRSLLSRTGLALAGTALVPVLPFDRAPGNAWAATGGDKNDQYACSYWRYCALDGVLCNSAGGSLTSCPPGSEASKVSWVGTCRNPNDGKDYLVSYNDCCGKPMAHSTECLTSERERPGYRMGLHNDINWCMANANKGYHCTVAVLVGMAE
ncbi:methylamine dehydrogenase light chain [Derxia lacustris]|uniref:methylamine dehydrogenase light chain n=1 Tax=Derxia lacustris TaxID=764842 RepID=UPI000A176F93|nr:methylamine dehydrogenase light chain [Derxia lacustris]